MKIDKKLLFISFLYQLLLLIIIVFFWWKEGVLNNQQSLMEKLQAWDSHHYLYLSEYGYVNSGDEANFIVFFPLYPIIINLLNLLIPSSIICALVVSNFASIFGHFFLLKLLIKQNFSKEFIIKTVLLVFFNPLAVYFFNIYTEGLFYFFSVLFFYLLSEDKYLKAIFIGFLASLTRMTGFLLFFPFIYYLLIFKNKWHLSIIIKSFLIGFGMIIYLFINFIVFRDYFKFSEVLKIHWSKQAQNPIINIISYFKQIEENGLGGFFTYSVDILSTIIFIFCFILYLFKYLFKKKKLVPNHWLLWIFLQWIIVASQSFWLSSARYIFMMFPIYPMIVDLFGKKKLIYILILAGSVFLFFKGVYFYSLGAWLY